MSYGINYVVVTTEIVEGELKRTSTLHCFLEDAIEEAKRDSQKNGDALILERNIPLYEDEELTDVILLFSGDSFNITQAELLLTRLYAKLKTELKDVGPVTSRKLPNTDTMDAILALQELVSEF